VRGRKSSAPTERKSTAKEGGSQKEVRRTFKMLREVWLNIGVEKIDTHEGMMIKVVTNFIQSYLHQIFNDFHGLNASLKPLRKPFDRCQSRLEAINIGRDIKQINW